MNQRIEAEFVGGYITKCKRERLLFELQGKGRMDGVMFAAAAGFPTIPPPNWTSLRLCDTIYG